jgi:chromate transporter
MHVVFAEVETRDWGPLRVEVPAPASLDPIALLIAAVALLALLRFKLPVLGLLGLSAAAGVLARLLAP